MLSAVFLPMRRSGRLIGTDERRAVFEVRESRNRPTPGTIITPEMLFLSSTHVIVVAVPKSMITVGPSENSNEPETFETISDPNSLLKSILILNPVFVPDPMINGVFPVSFLTA